MVWKGCWMKAGYLLNWPFFESLGLCQFGGEGWKILSVGHCFSSIFKNSRKNNGQAFSVTFAQRPTWMSPGPGPHFKRSKTVEIRCSCYELKHCQREISTDYIQGKNYGEHSNIKAGALVHWLGQCQTKWLRGCSEFQNSAPIEPMLPNIQLLALTTKPSVRVDLLKTTVYGSSFFTTLSSFFACRIVIVGLLLLNIKTRKIYRNSRLQTFYWYILITLDIDWSWNILSLHINLRKVRTEDLKFRTDLPWSTRSSYGCLVSNTVDDYFE